MSTFYRAVSARERDDIASCGRLRAPAQGGTEGKYVTTTLEHAREFGRLFIRAGWQSQAHIVRVTFSSQVTVWDELATDPPAGPSVVLYAAIVDQIGPGYFANDEALEYATVEIVAEVVDERR